MARFLTLIRSKLMLQNVRMIMTATIIYSATAKRPVLEAYVKPVMIRVPV